MLKTYFSFLSIPFEVDHILDLFSPSGSFSNSSVTISPISGVVMIEIKYAHPNPILRRAPSKPTSTDTSEHVIIPNIITNVVIVVL